MQSCDPCNQGALLSTGWQDLLPHAGNQLHCAGLHSTAGNKLAADNKPRGGPSTGSNLPCPALHSCQDTAVTKKGVSFARCNAPTTLHTPMTESRVSVTQYTNHMKAAQLQRWCVHMPPTNDTGYLLSTVGKQQCHNTIMVCHDMWRPNTGLYSTDAYPTTTWWLRPLPSHRALSRSDVTVHTVSSSAHWCQHPWLSPLLCHPPGP